MHNISLFPQIFSDTAVNETTAMVKVRLGKGAKKGHALDIIAAANHFTDYKTAKGLYDKYLLSAVKTWVPEGVEDKDYSLLSGDGDFTLLNNYKADMLLEFDYCFDDNGCYTKKELIALMVRHGVVLFDYQVSGDGGGNPCFTVIIEDDLAKRKAFMADVYQANVADLYVMFDESVTSGILVANYIA
jgi:hypothetical protein